MAGFSASGSEYKSAHTRQLWAYAPIFLRNAGYGRINGGVCSLPIKALAHNSLFNRETAGNFGRFGARISAEDNKVACK